MHYYCHCHFSTKQNVKRMLTVDTSTTHSTDQYWQITTDKMSSLLPAAGSGSGVAPYKSITCQSNINLGITGVATIYSQIYNSYNNIPFHHHFNNVFPDLLSWTMGNFTPNNQHKNLFSTEITNSTIVLIWKAHWKQ